MPNLAKKLQGNIYFFCPDREYPVGGIKQIYRQVDVLRGYGYPAFVLHTRLGFRCTWFENSTKIKYLGEKKTNIFCKKEDILVIPETLVQEIQTNSLEKIIIFNQSGHYTFRDWGYINDIKNPYLDKNILAVITISKYSYDYLKWCFPNKKVYRIRPGIDSKIFVAPRPNSKENLISFMPRRNLLDVEQVYQILRIRDQGIIKSYDFVAIKDMSEKEVARILQKTKFFLDFGAPEGFGLPAAEAMLCGCVVIGYPGGGGNEFYNPKYSFPIIRDDIKNFVSSIEKAVSIDKRNPKLIEKMGQEASRKIFRSYNTLNEAKDIVSVWRKILRD